MHRFLHVTSSDPVLRAAVLLRLESLLVAEKGRNAVPPPQLPGNAPISRILHPAVPGIFLRTWHDDEFLVFDYFHHPIGYLCALDVPLGFYQRLDDVCGPLAQPQSHLIVLLLHP